VELGLKLGIRKTEKTRSDLSETAERSLILRIIGLCLLFKHLRRIRVGVWVRVRVWVRVWVTNSSIVIIDICLFGFGFRVKVRVRVT
jgi:hypothetical protein